LKPCRNVSDFVANPLSQYLARRSSVVWAQSATLAGSVYFGRPDDGDFPSRPELGVLPWSPRFRTGYDVIVDFSGLVGLSPRCFRLLSNQLRDARGRAGELGRVAFIRSQGVVGTVIAGLFHELVKCGFDSVLVSDLDAALDWLDRADADFPRVELQEMIENVRDEPQLLRALRSYLREHRHQATLEEVAAALALSERSLQRRLSELGTSFRAEINRSRVRAAEELLVETDAKLEAIARQVGCSSASQLSTLFRSVAGETPSSFRERHRRG
jgi:AraC-like DNA-binding protein